MDPIVATTSGQVRGTVADGVCSFRGLPYAAPPVGERRFLPPALPTSWDGVRDGTQLAPACPQPRLPRLFGNLDPSVIKFAERYDEDCLTLNVFSAGAPGDDLPVMVWFHGGWFTIGSGNEPAYDGTRLAALGAVVVTVTHRLGPLGFLHLDDVPGSGNAGLLDLVAALEWVQHNIVEFGGDPGCVAIFGESGGGCKVSALLAMPAAVGLFHRAVIQSGPLLRAVEIEDARSYTSALRQTAGAHSADDLRALDVADLIAAATTTVGGPMGGMYGDGPRFAPVVDGSVLPRHPFDPDSPEISSDVPLLIGSCRDEATMLAVTTPGLSELSDDGQVAFLAEHVVGHGHLDLVERYLATRPGSTALDRLLAAVTDQLRVGGIRIAERRLASGGAPVFCYRLDLTSPVLGGVLGALHAYDVGFVFLNTDAPAGVSSLNGGLYPDTEAVARVTAQMSHAWLAFARTGAPGHDELPTWPAYDVDRRATMIFAERTHVDNDPDGAERAIWDGRPVGM